MGCLYTNRFYICQRKIIKTINSLTYLTYKTYLKLCIHLTFAKWKILDYCKSAYFDQRQGSFVNNALQNNIIILGTIVLERYVNSNVRHIKHNTLLTTL